MEHSQSSSCFAEQVLYDYFAGNLQLAESASVASHIATCTRCLEIFAAFDPIIIAAETSAEKALLDPVYQLSRDAAYQLMPGEAHQPSAPSPVSAGTVFQTRARPVLPRYLLAAAAVLVLALGFVTWIAFRNAAATDPDFMRGLAALNEANRSGRPLELRLGNFAYAPFIKERAWPLEADRRKLEGARHALAAATARQPSAAAHQALAQVLISLNEFNEAITHLEAAARLAPGDSAITVDLAVAQAEQGDGLKALAALNDLLAREPAHQAALFNRAIVYERLRRFHEARRDWERYLEIDAPSEWGREAASRREALKER